MSPAVQPSSQPEGQDETLTPAARDALGSLVVQFLRLQGEGHREKRKQDAEEPDENGGVAIKSDYREHGRTFARLGGPFERIATIVHHGLAMNARESDNETELTVQETRLTESWCILIKVVPTLEAQMVELAQEGLVHRTICSQMAKGVDDARGDDTSSLKLHILGYLLLDHTQALDPPIPAKYALKSYHGWNHQVTAELLTPIGYTPGKSFNNDVKEGRVHITANQFPRFLYPEDKVYEEDEFEEGLFKGHCAKHMFIGPGSALQAAGWQKGHAGVTKIIKMDKMTPRALAYVACQVRFALSDVQEWNQMDRDFDYQVFYWNLVSLFDDGELADVLRFYNHELFGAPLDGREPLGARSSNEPSEDNPLERLKARRVAKRARAGVVQGPGGN
ncbi:hypothetical protein OE88DRAFT_1738301 [Heliocybe sulcata]|uniref:Uncharacterized protein n=1 Tax=Heliocybe sulcata TaxID=5364 RepID=A0A5C3MQS9_9AGAM|nr:hypothetical protein OE88DRAFT_1738301 [Heliocybe sulcata]